MIQYFFENVEEISLPENCSEWVEKLILNEEKKVGNINYIFCDDEYLLKVNQDFLNHDYYTDIITFDYVKGKTISGDIFISLTRISENASTLSSSFEKELLRVLAHGVLHLCGYKDKSDEEEKEMFNEEIEAFFDYKKLLSVWQLVFEDRVLEKCVENWKHSPHIGLDNEEKLRDDLIPFDLIENKEDEIFLLHKVNGGIYFYYAFTFVIKVADNFDEFIDNLYEI